MSDEAYERRVAQMAHARRIRLLRIARRRLDDAIDNLKEIAGSDYPPFTPQQRGVLLTLLLDSPVGATE